MAVFSVPSNYFITYPAYVQFYHMPLEAILGMYQAILPSADSLIKCLVIFNMPFTLVKGLLDAVLCMLIYKPLSPITTAKLPGQVPQCGSRPGSCYLEENISASGRSG